MSTVTVQALSTTGEMERYLQSQVSAKEAFIFALDCDVSHVDARAQVYDVRITAVEFDESSIGVSYEVDYTIYNGCKDMDVDDSEDRFVSGQRTPAGWEFKHYVQPPKRTTVDEF